MEGREPSYTVGGNVNQYIYYGEQYKQMQAGFLPYPQVPAPV